MNILEKLNAIKNQEITAKENVEAYIKVIEEKNEDINAFLELNKEEAIAKAEEIDAKIKAGEEVGALAGLVFGIKANINVEDFIISAASKTLEDYIGSYATQLHLEESLVVQVEEVQQQLQRKCVTLQSVPILVDLSETHLPTVECLV